jgi:hypothetical protein
MLGEDVQDQRGAVDDLDLGLLLQRAELARGQLAVADHRVGTGLDHHVAQLGDLAAADERGGVGVAAPLDQPLEYLRARGLGEGGQLGQGVLRVGGGTFGPDADQDHPFEAELAVLDLGDVGQFGGQPGDPAQRVPLFELEIPVGIDVAGTRRREECVSHVPSIVTRVRCERTTIQRAVGAARKG